MSSIQNNKNTVNIPSDMIAVPVDGWQDYKYKDIIFSIEQKTGEIYERAPSLVLRTKALALIAATPIVSIARAIYYFAKAIFLVGQGKFNTSRESFEDIARSLFYGVAMVGAATYMFFDPKAGRQCYGKLERQLNREEISNRFSNTKIYLAPCMQAVTTTVLLENDTGKRQLDARVDNINNRMKYFSWIKHLPWNKNESKNGARSGDDFGWIRACVSSCDLLAASSFASSFEVKPR